jgi:hypothetical protein
MTRKAPLQEAHAAISRSIADLRMMGIVVPVPLQKAEALLRKHNESVAKASAARLSSIRKLARGGAEGRVPPPAQMNDVVGCDDVQTNAGGLRGKNQQSKTIY